MIKVQETHASTQCSSMIRNDDSVQYISSATNQIISSSDRNIFLVDNQALVELTDRTGAVEQEAATAKEKAIAAETKADTAVSIATAADTKATDAQSRADILQARADELRARADAADDERLAAKLEREAAKIERLANAADAKATAANTKADTALAGNADLQSQIDNLSAQSCVSGEYVTGLDTAGTIICSPVIAGTPAISLLAYYPLDGDVFDASGNAYNGTIGGTEAYDVGHTGQAFSFNRATYIATDLDIDVSVEPQLTMGAWVRPVGGFYGQVLTHDDQGFDRSLIYYNGDWRAYDGSGGGSVHTGMLAATGGWQFVAVVYD